MEKLDSIYAKAIAVIAKKATLKDFPKEEHVDIKVMMDALPKKEK